MVSNGPRAARDAGVPVLGICRGMQLLNVAYGGTLHQHLPAVLDDDHYRALPAGFSSHDVQTEPGSSRCSRTITRGSMRSATG